MLLLIYKHVKFTKFPLFDIIGSSHQGFNKNRALKNETSKLYVVTVYATVVPYNLQGLAIVTMVTQCSNVFFIATLCIICVTSYNWHTCNNMMST